jgi:hypothetical protein
LNTDGPTDGDREDYNVDLDTDGAGHWFAVWERRLDTDTDMIGAQSTDNGLTWLPPTCVNTNCGVDAALDTQPRVSCDRRGRVGFAWNATDAFGPDSDVLAATVLDPLTLPSTYCLGHADFGTRCPCGNDAALTERSGCLNSTGIGAYLDSVTIASISNGSIVLGGSGMPPNSNALYFQGTAAIAGGDGSAFGDGLRCVGGAVVRLGIVQNSSSGTSNRSAPATGLSVGSTRFYQAWYRNAAAFCTASTFNLTNGVAATWGP